MDKPSDTAKRINERLGFYASDFRVFIEKNLFTFRHVVSEEIEASFRDGIDAGIFANILVREARNKKR